MLLQTDQSLQPFHTFATPAYARHFGCFADVPTLQTLLRQSPGPVMVLGGGSNVLFRCDFEGTILKNDILGIDITQTDTEYVHLRVGAGEAWHALVMHCVARGWGGIENLALIPGTVGAAPIQNIGAYGVELASVLTYVEGIDLKTLDYKRFAKEECDFGYRESIFKTTYKGQFVITHVGLALRKRPQFVLDYGPLQAAFSDQAPSLERIAQAVIQIRQSKLPDPKQLGNSGSFFKNPILPRQKFEKMKAHYPHLPAYPQTDGVKIPAGWLIEQCGWKGKRIGNTGTYAKQALVLVNYGNATGEEIYALSEQIIASVEARFGVRLEREVNVL